MPNMEIQPQPDGSEQAQEGLEQKPKFSKSLTQKIKAAKSQNIGNTQQALGNFIEEIL